MREARGWTLSVSAQELGVSISYLSQIEANQRPVTARIFAALSDTFGVAAAALDADDGQRLVADLREALADEARAEAPVTLSEIRQVAIQSPAFARRYLDLHRAFRRLDERLKLADEAVGLDEAVAASALLPYEEVRDFFNDKNNYIDNLDRAAEALAAEIGHRQEVVVVDAAGLAAEFDPERPGYRVVFGMDAAPAGSLTGLPRLLREGPRHGSHLLSWWRDPRRFGHEAGGEEVAGLMFLNVPQSDVVQLLGRAVDWQPRPNRALLHDRHADRTVIVAPFLQPEGDEP